MKTMPDKQPAARLLDALAQTDELTCEQAHDLIPALVDAELAGEDVDSAPQYAALLRHLDECEHCATLYAGIADDLATLAEPSMPLPAVQPNAPTFFAPARQSENVVLRVFAGLVRHFELSLRVPQLTAGMATLSGGSSTTVFLGTLPEVEGSPLVSASIEEATTDLLVAIREASADTRWQVQVAIAEIVQTATTDERGIARFSGLPIESLSQIRLNCSELRD